MLICLSLLAGAFFAHAQTAPSPSILDLGNVLSSKGSLSRSDIDQISIKALQQTADQRPVSEQLQIDLLEFEAKYAVYFDQEARKAFQTLVAQVGAKMNGKIAPPENTTPLFLKDPGPLDHFQSSPTPPIESDYVVIGAGLTGSSAAIELATEAKLGKTVVVLEAGPRPAFGASGRNGGNIEMMKESFLSDYRGFIEVQKEILRKHFPNLSEEEVQFQGKRQAKYLLKFFQANVREILRLAEEYNIQADISMKGWLRVADSKKEEKGLNDEIEFAKSLGLKFELWSKEKIEGTYEIQAKHAGRFIQESGNYHPVKFVDGVLQAAIKQGVQLYTDTKAIRIEKQADGRNLIYTNKGKILAKKIVVATNVYTRELFQDMDYIEPRVGHVADFNDVEDTFHGITVTMRKGDWYGNFPLAYQYIDASGKPRGILHVGAGKDTPIPPDRIHNPPFMKRLFEQTIRETALALPKTAGRPPIASWSGVMAFTSDRSPILSFMYRQGITKPDTSIVFAVAFNGYGGSQSIAAGKFAAIMSKTGQSLRRTLPSDLFSMKRFQTRRPLFKSKAATCKAIMQNKNPRTLWQP